MNLRRNRIGTRAADLYSWQPQNFSEMEGPLAVQEYIQQMISKEKTLIKRTGFWRHRGHFKPTKRL